MDLIKKIALYLLFFLFLSSCKGQNSEYVNHNRWSIEGYTFLKDHPKEITEIRFSNLTDTLFSATFSGVVTDTIFYQFDINGNLIFSSTKFNSSDFTYLTSSFYHWDKNGYQYEFFTNDSAETGKKEIFSKLISKRIGANKFESSHYSKDKKSYTDIITFLDGKPIVMKERRKGDTLLFTESTYYSGDRLQKIIHKDQLGGIETEQLFYYSTNSFLDSITLSGGGVIALREIYLNNEFGDPIYYEESYFGSVKEKKWMRYEYDEKGNWIRKITKSENDRNTMFFPSNEETKFPGYELITRDIVY